MASAIKLEHPYVVPFSFGGRTCEIHSSRARRTSLGGLCTARLAGVQWLVPPQSRCALSTRQRAPDPAPSGVSVSYSIRRAQGPRRGVCASDAASGARSSRTARGCCKRRRLNPRRRPNANVTQVKHASLRQVKLYEQS